MSRRRWHSIGAAIAEYIYNVTTLERARRRGLGTALTAVHLHDALGRGCQTASLQSTEMAEGIYAALGFRDLGRILEYVP
jgi:predicted GNAT family acetyltransferase